jgi:G3E family GTPase
MPRIPAHVVAGPLGVGKTTTLLSLFRHRPPAERWAVVVNEFGAVGIDGAVLSSAGDVAVKEIAGGCVCCVAGPALRAAIVQILRQQRPDRLFVEPTGLAHPAAIVDLLRSPGIAEHVDPRGVIVLLDPRRLRPADPLFRDLVSAADVLVAHRADEASEAQLEAFRTFAASLWPPPARVLVASHGELPADVLDAPAVEHPRAPGLHPLPVVEELGLVWPPEVVFDAARLTAALQGLARPGGPALPAGVERAKGLFHTERGWWLVHATADRIATEPVGWRRDSRVELLSSGPIDRARVAEVFSAALRGEGSSREL